MTEAIIEKYDQGVLTLVLNRPDALNAINGDIMNRLHEIFVDGVEDYKDMRVAIITGSGDKAFIAGADIKEFPEMSEEQGRALSKKGHKIFSAIEQSRFPVIAMINGFSLGGGNELAMSCHLRIAEEHAKFGQPEVNLGLVPGYGGTVRLGRYIGHTRALYYLLTGNMFGAEDALNWGLVNQVVPKGEGMATAEKLALKLASKAPLAMDKMITIMRRQWESKAMEMEMEYFGQSFGTADMKEGVAAFMEKRKAEFKGL